MSLARSFRKKGEKTTEEIDLKRFFASNGLLKKIRSQHLIAFKSVYGECADGYIIFRMDGNDSRKYS